MIIYILKKILIPFPPPQVASKSQGPDNMCKKPPETDRRHP